MWLYWFKNNCFMSNVLSLLAEMLPNFHSSFFLRTKLDIHVNDSGFKILE